MLRVGAPRLLLLIAVCAIGAIGCGTSRAKLMEMDDSQLKLRSIQTRAFDTTDRDQTLRTVIATLQDLGFVISDANERLGTVSGTKLEGYELRVTVTVRQRGETQMLVRANAEYQLATVADPEPYQNFFIALEKAMFLTAQQVD